jgi:gas vesicle protein
MVFRTASETQPWRCSEPKVRFNPTYSKNYLKIKLKLKEKSIMSEQHNASVLALVSFAVGVLVGAVMALFLAPMSGRELRGRIGEEAQLDWQRATDRWHQSQAEMRQAMDSMRQQMEASELRMREQLSDQLSQLQAKIEAGEPAPSPEAEA